MAQQPRLQLPVLAPIYHSHGIQAIFPPTLHVLTHVLCATLHSTVAFKRLLAENTTATLRRRVSKLVAALSDFIQSSFHCSNFTLYAAFSLAVVGRQDSCVGRMHAPDVLHEEVFTVEIVWSIGRIGALVAAPEAHAEMLSHGVAFPFVFGVES